MAGLAQKIRDAFGFTAAQGQAKKRLEGREARSTNPTKGESVVVRPRKKVKKVVQE